MIRNLGVALLLLASFGCQRSGTAIAQRGDGQEFTTLAAVGASKVPGDEATLVVAGTEVPVSIEARDSEGKLHLDLIAHDATFESETYLHDESQFAVIEAAGETYEPPLVLLKFPFSVGDAYTWEGSIVAGGIERRASATISTSSDRIYEGQVPHETIKVLVDLQFRTDPRSAPAKRALQFWISPEKGVIQREFGTASVRKLREP